MSIRRLLRWTLLSITLVMVLGYTWLMEENLASGVLFSAQIRLNREADAWIAAQGGGERVRVELASSKALPPVDGTPWLYAERSLLPVLVLEALEAELKDGQVTVIEIDDVGFLNTGYLVHLCRISPKGQELHFVQRLVLAEHEQARVHEFDASMYKRVLFPAAFFVLISACIVYLFGRRVASSTNKLLAWSEALSIEELPDEPVKLPFEEMQRIAGGTLDSLRRERDAIESRHRFLRFASHELRTPLAIACANTELLARHGVGPGAQPALARLGASVQDMKRLTDALLWLGRGEAPLPEPEPVDLDALVRALIQDNQALAQANKLRVEHVAGCSTSLMAPRVLVSILLSNLMSNALRYTKDGRVEIRTGPQSLLVENQGRQLGGEPQGYGLGLQLVAWVVERANWSWEEEGGETFRRYTVSF